MRWTGKDKQNVLRDMKQLGANYDRIVALIPNKTPTHYDPLEDSSLDPSDITSDDTGNITTWLVRELYVRYGGPTHTEMMLTNGQGRDKDDMTLYVKLEDIALINSVLTDNDAYFFIGGDTYKPFGTVNFYGIFGKQEGTVDCKHSTPRIRAAGY